LLELCEHFFVDERWPLVSCPTQHDAVADRDDLETRFVALEPGEDELESAFEVCASIRSPFAFLAAKLGCEPIPSS
jgi:hypothetical protein